MGKSELYYFFLAGFPETVTLTLLAFALARLEFKAAPVFSVASALNVTTFLVRRLQIFFGIRIVLLTFFLALAIYTFQRNHPARIITASSLAMAVLTLLNTLTICLFNWAWPEYFAAAGQNSMLWLLSSYPYIAVTALLAFLLNAHNKKKTGAAGPRTILNRGKNYFE